MIERTGRPATEFGGPARPGKPERTEERKFEGGSSGRDRQSSAETKSRLDQDWSRRCRAKDMGV